MAGLITVIQLCDPRFPVKTFFFLQDHILVQGVDGDFKCNLWSDDFGCSDASTESRKKERSDIYNLGEMGARGSGDESVEKWVKWFSYQVPNSGHHDNVSVCYPRLAGFLDFLDGEGRRETKWAKIAERGDRTG